MILTPFQADMGNLFFKVISIYFVWTSVIRLYRDQEVSGVDWRNFGWHALWGVWNLIYYSTLLQYLSFFGSVFVVLGNLTWTVMYLRLRWGRNKEFKNA